MAEDEASVTSNDDNPRENNNCQTGSSKPQPEEECPRQQNWQVSMDERRTNWINLLGVRNKPDQLVDWDHLYNLQDQAELRRQCQKVLQNISNEASGDKQLQITLPDLESMVTLWCKKRKIEQASKLSWMGIMNVLIKMEFNNPTLFNIFYSITTKYIPRDLDEGGKAYDLFRLIMQYHDPALCSHLTSLKIAPYSYASSWFQSLFSADLSSNLCFVLWDIYFEKADPFLIFFIALCMLQASRDTILQMNDREKIIEFIKDIPKAMNAEDIVDLVDVCNVCIDLTPISVREDFHCMIFGANMVEEFYEFPLHTLICLPISVQELYKRVIDVGGGSSASYNYFVIDTRSQKDFNAGSVNGFYNLDSRLLVDEPEKFTLAINSLLQFKKESSMADHICFFGSGFEDDDAFMMMVVSRFLQQNHTHVSYVDGGFRALHLMLKETNNLNKLSNHFSPEACVHCNSKSNEKIESLTWTLMERMNLRKKDIADAARSFSEMLPKGDLFGKDSAKHVKSNERNQKRYRNVQSVFSIEDGDSSEEDLVAEMESLYSNEKLKWEDILKQPEYTHHFVGHEVLSDKSTVPCYIGVSRTQMHIFHDVRDSKGFVRTSARHGLSTVIRVTCKRMMPEYITFSFGYELPTGETHINRVHKFILKNSGDLATACKNNIFALMPSKLR